MLFHPVLQALVKRRRRDHRVELAEIMEVGRKPCPSVLVSFAIQQEVGILGRLKHNRHPRLPPAHQQVPDVGATARVRIDPQISVAGKRRDDPGVALRCEQGLLS